MRTWLMIVIGLAVGSGGLAGALAVTGDDRSPAGATADAPTDVEQVRDVTSTFYRAMTDGDGPAACSLLTGSAQRELADKMATAGATGCADAIQIVSSYLDAEQHQIGTDVTVSAVRIDGATATVPDSSLTGGDGKPLSDGNPAPMTLVERDDTWLIDTLG